MGLFDELIRLRCLRPWNFLFAPTMELDLVIACLSLKHRRQFLRNLSLFSLWLGLFMLSLSQISCLWLFPLFFERLKVHVVDNRHGWDVLAEFSSNELPVRVPSLAPTLPCSQPFCRYWKVLFDRLWPLGIRPLSFVLLTLRWSFAIPPNYFFV